jgi:hypothetical protein
MQIVPICSVSRFSFKLDSLEERKGYVCDFCMNFFVKSAGCIAVKLFSISFTLIRYFHLTDQLMEELPPYMFLTAFSQLVSRLCHPHPDVFRHLKTIIVYMLLVYSQQSLWMLMPVYKVCVLERAEARK